VPRLGGHLARGLVNTTGDNDEADRSDANVLAADGVPAEALLTHGSPVRMYEDVCTLENMLELRQYASQRGWLLRAEELDMGDVHPGSRQVAPRAPGCYRTRFPCVSQTSTLPMLRARTLDSTARRSPTTTTMGGSSRSTRAAAAWLFAGLTAASRSR